MGKAFICFPLFQDTPSILKDTRFQTLFTNPDMQIDTNNEYFKNIAPLISRLQKPETDGADDDTDPDEYQGQDADQGDDQDSDDDFTVWIDVFRWFHFLWFRCILFVIAADCRRPSCFYSRASVTSGIMCMHVLPRGQK